MDLLDIITYSLLAVYVGHITFEFVNYVVTQATLCSSASKITIVSTMEFPIDFSIDQSKIVLGIIFYCTLYSFFGYYAVKMLMNDTSTTTRRRRTTKSASASASTKPTAMKTPCQATTASTHPKESRFPEFATPIMTTTTTTTTPTPVFVFDVTPPPTLSRTSSFVSSSTSSTTSTPTPSSPTSTVSKKVENEDDPETTKLLEEADIAYTRFMNGLKAEERALDKLREHELKCQNHAAYPEDMPYHFMGGKATNEMVAAKKLLLDTLSQDIDKLAVFVPIITESERNKAVMQLCNELDVFDCIGCPNLRSHRDDLLQKTINLYNINTNEDDDWIVKPNTSRRSKTIVVETVDESDC
jgi:hypothetical protein